MIISEVAELLFALEVVFFEIGLLPRYFLCQQEPIIDICCIIVYHKLYDCFPIESVTVLTCSKLILYT